MQLYVNVTSIVTAVQFHLARAAERRALGWWSAPTPAQVQTAAREYREVCRVHSRAGDVVVAAA